MLLGLLYSLVGSPYRSGASLDRQAAELTLGAPSRLSGIGVVFDQAGQEGNQTGALLGREWGEKLLLHLGEQAIELAEPAAAGRSHDDDVTAAIARVE